MTKSGGLQDPFLFFFLIDFIYLFLEQGEGKEKEREENRLPLARPHLGATGYLTGNQSRDISVYRPVNA